MAHIIRLNKLYNYEPRKDDDKPRRDSKPRAKKRKPALGSWGSASRNCTRTTSFGIRAILSFQAPTCGV